ncbi:hypothetical protein, partial [Enterococcus florum]|uniref:hypothetical protein n=1 Tax=Enterococcus florum TaxID=2480627 RepID=UPI001D132294
WMSVGFSIKANYEIGSIMSFFYKNGESFLDLVLTKYIFFKLTSIIYLQSPLPPPIATVLKSKVLITITK